VIRSGKIMVIAVPIPGPTITNVLGTGYREKRIKRDVPALHATTIINGKTPRIARRRERFARAASASLLASPTTTNPAMTTMFIGMIPATPERTNQANAETPAGPMIINARAISYKGNG